VTTTTEATTEPGFAAALVRLSHLVQHVFADVSRDHDITPQQTQLLCMLIGGPVGMTELSRLMHLEKSSLTGLVDRGSGAAWSPGSATPVTGAPAGSR
jgi:DNA-binding MarR family transcriptional regulator